MHIVHSTWYINIRILHSSFGAQYGGYTTLGLSGSQYSGNVSRNKPGRWELVPLAKILKDRDPTRTGCWNFVVPDSDPNKGMARTRYILTACPRKHIRKYAIAYAGLCTTHIGPDQSLSVYAGFEFTRNDNHFLSDVRPFSRLWLRFSCIRRLTLKTTGRPEFVMLTDAINSGSNPQRTSRRAS